MSIDYYFSGKFFDFRYRKTSMSQPLLVFAGVGVAFIAIVTPGPTVLLALRNGSRYGVRASMAGMAGAILADFVLISLVAIGLGALLSTSEGVFKAAKWIGAFYLTYLGIRLLYSEGRFALPDKGDKTQGIPIVIISLRSFLVAVTNPKSFLFFLALLPQFVTPTQDQWPQYASLALIFVVIDFIVMLGYASAGAQAIWFFRARRVLWLDRLCGAALLMLAASLAFLSRPGVMHI